MADILQLQHLRAVEVDDQGDHYRIAAEGTLTPFMCEHCGANGFHGHGHIRQSYIDTPIHGKRVLLEIDRKRYRCKICGKTMFQPMPDIDDKRLATRRLVKFIEDRCTKLTFAELSRQVGVDDKTIRHIFDDYASRMALTVKFETPVVLGIDEIKVVGQYRCVITNIQELSLFDILPSRKKAELIPYFKRLPDKKNVRAIVMDLWSVYRQVADECFPGVPVVADKFHVVRMANEAIEKSRKAVRKQLNTRQRLKLKDDRFLLLAKADNLSEPNREKLAEWKETFPELGACHEAKERFFSIFDATSRADAAERLDSWKEELDPLAMQHFLFVLTAVDNWRNEILNMFDVPVSNGYTESLNNLIKGMNRMGRGYSFEVLRARMLYDEIARQPTRKVIRRKVQSSGTSAGMSDMMGRGIFKGEAGGFQTIEQAIEYGPHIPQLVELLERGHFS